MLKDLLNKLLKKDTAQTDTTSSAIPTNIDHLGWYSDRYETVVTQRNILVFISLISFVAVMIAIFVVGQISTSKTFSPFVIQIEEKTGYAKVVNPINSSILSGNESLSRYFIKKYLEARETYNPVDYESNLKKNVRLFSTPNVYRDYIGYIKTPTNDPTLIYGDKNTTFMKVKSFSRLDNQYFIRFSVIETSGAKAQKDKIATITIDYIPMELTESERDINPVGFQVTGYRVDDDNS